MQNDLAGFRGRDFPGQDAVLEFDREQFRDVAALGDPGYAATAVIFGEVALGLALDPIDSPGGVLTPAVALGDTLVDRLHARGVELSVQRTG